MTAARRLWVPLTERHFRLLWFGQSVSAVGDALQFIAIAWLVLDVTESPIALSGIFLANTIPRVLFSLLGGVAADRFDTRDIMLWSDGIRASLVGAMAVLAAGSWLTLPVLFGLVCLQAIVGSLFAPAATRSIPCLVSGSNVQAANALHGMTQQLAYVLGATLGGTVVTVFGASTALGINAATFAVATWCAFRLPSLLASSGMTSQMSPTKSALEGVRYVLGSPWLRILFALDAAVVLIVAGPLTVGLPLLIRNQTGDATGLGYLLGAFGAGTAAGMVLTGARPAFRRPGVMFGVLCLLQAPFLLGLAMLPLTIGIVCTAALGFLNGAAEIVWTGLLQTHVSPQLLGRTLSFASLLSVALQPLSQVATGAMTASLGPSGVFAVAAVALFFVAGACLLGAGLQSVEGL